MVPTGFAMAEDSQSKTTSTDSAGTSITTERSQSTETGLGGAVKSKSEVTTVVDPKGLNNKISAETTHSRVNRKDGDFEDTVTINRGDGTAEEQKVVKGTSEHWLDDGKTQTTTRTKVIDPPNLGNKQVTKSTESIELNADGTKKQS